MNSKPEPQHVVIDRGTKVGWGILVVLITATGGGAMALGRITSEVSTLNILMAEVKHAIDRNTHTIASNDKLLAVVQSLVEANRQRIEKLEKDPK